MRTITLALLTTALAATTAQAGWFDSSCDYKAARRVATPAAGVTRITIIGRAGSLRVEGRNGAGEVSANGTACASSQSTLDEVKLVASRSGSDLTVEAVIPDDLVLESAALDFSVVVPANIPLRVRDGSGSTDIMNVASLDVTDGSGDLNIRQVNGNLTIDDGSGGIDVQDVTGDVTITDGSGSIDVTRVGGSVSIPRDGSGSIDITDVRRDVTIVTKGSGGVNVAKVGGNFTVDRKGSGRISYESVAGRVSVPERR